MNYRKRIKILPGVTINLSKSGISTTIGIKGFSVNVGQNGAYLNTGIPGTGLYQRHKIGNINNPLLCFKVAAGTNLKWLGDAD